MWTIRSHVWLHDEDLGRVTIQNLEGRRRRKVGYMSEKLFWWVSKAVGGRWRGVLVPDPYLSGAAVFTVRKEAVNCVCSHLSKMEQLLTHPHT